MEPEEKPLAEVIEELAVEVAGYAGMLAHPGFKTLELEIEAYVAARYDELAVCSLDRVKELQGQIASLKWMRELPDKAAERLEELQKQKREAEATE